MFHGRGARGQRGLQPRAEMADAGEEQIAADPPDQQAGEGDRLRMVAGIAVGLGSRQLAQHRALRVAGAINHHQQRQRHTEHDAVRDAQGQLCGDDDCGQGKFPTASGEQIAQIGGLGEVEHRRDHDGGERRIRHAAEQRRQKDQRQKAKGCGDEVGDLGAGAGGHRDRGLGQAADHEKAAKEPGRDIGRSVRDQLLVRVDIAAALHRRSLGRAQRLGIADEHDRQRTRRKLPQYGGVENRQRQMRQPGRQLAHHVDARGCAAEQADRDRGGGSDDEGRGHTGREAAQRQHRRQAQHPRG